MKTKRWSLLKDSKTLLCAHGFVGLPSNMGETRTSVKDVIPEAGTAFNLDENVIKGQPISW
jgi:hypothetical protein